MLKNYLTLALKVLRRKPFYTFVSLFGISFTLMILMLITSMGDALFGANPPMTDVDRMVFLQNVERYTPSYDTTYTLDSVLMDTGVMRYDSSPVVTEGNSRTMNSGSASFHFLSNQLQNLEDVSDHAFYSDGRPMDIYLDGRKISFATTYVDADYWRVFDFTFLSGAPFGQDDITQANKVAVMTDRAAREYFGKEPGLVIGQEIDLGGEKFRVVGIVARPLMDHPAILAGVYLPLTTIDSKVFDSKEIYGPFRATFKATSPAKRASVANQLAFIAENFEMPPEEQFERLGLKGFTRVQDFAGNLAGVDDEDPDLAVYTLFGPILAILLLFISLPLINLVNLNISRVIERKSEIAVRKAFGADSKNILYQFIFENLVLTFIGGAVGLLLAYAIIQYNNTNDLLGGLRLAYTPRVFFYFMLLILVFGLLSGLLPAYRMSRTNIGDALR